MFTHDDYLLLHAMEANGLAPNVGDGYDPNAEFDRYSDRSPIFDLPAVDYPSNAQPIDLLSLTPGMDTSQPPATSHPYSGDLIGSDVLPSPPQASPGTSPYHDPSGLNVQFDNSDLGVGQWPGPASHNSGGQIIGMGSQPNLRGSPPNSQDHANTDENTYAARPNSSSPMATNVGSTQTPESASGPTQGNSLQPPEGWWQVQHPGLKNDPFTTPETIAQELRTIDTYRTDKGLRFADTLYGQAYQKILNDRLNAMQQGVPIPGMPNQAQATGTDGRPGPSTPIDIASPGANPPEGPQTDDFVKNQWQVAMEPSEYGRLHLSPFDKLKPLTTTAKSPPNGPLKQSNPTLELQSDLNQLFQSGKVSAAPASKGKAPAPTAAASAGSDLSNPLLLKPKTPAERLAAFNAVKEAAKRSGDPHPEVAAAQWAIESGWGSKPSGRFNLFGVKIRTGEPGSSVVTSEVKNGVRQKTTGTFRDYKSPEEAMVGHTHVVTGYPSYVRARTPEEAGRALHKGGYFTEDPKKYLPVMQSIIHMYNRP